MSYSNFITSYMFSYTKEIGELDCLDHVITGVYRHRYRHSYRHGQGRTPLWKPLTLHETMSDNNNHRFDGNDVTVPLEPQHNIILLKEEEGEQHDDRHDSFNSTTHYIINNATPVMSSINIDTINVKSPSNKVSNEIIKRLHTHEDDVDDGDDDGTSILPQNNTSYRRSFVQVDRYIV